MLDCMQVNAIDRLLSAAEITQLLGVSRRTFESIVRRDEAPPCLLIGRQRRWRSQDVVAWLDRLAANSEQRRAAGKARAENI